MSESDKKDGSSEPWGHIHVALRHMNKPASDIDKTEGLGWGFDPEKTRTEVNGKAANARLDQEELETLTYLSEGERLDTSIEKVLATLSNDLVALAYRSDFMRTSVSVKGKGRIEVGKMIGGSTPKISVPTTLAKRIKVLTGRGDKQEESVTEEWQS